MKYVQLLIKWQRSQRLVGSSEPDWIIDHIVVDSLLFARLLPSTTERILDVGSGAGVPGIPLKIVHARTSFTLLEARAKRASFLSAVIRELALEHCEVVNERLENVVQKRAVSYDAAVLRCAGNPAELMGAAFPVLKPGGLLIAAGPPRRRTAPGGDWVEVEGPRGPRLFWIARKA